ncbi:hypothetical protein I5907_09120 [Panacibacter sp. DH6]|uniref:Uncharacterized protein n=1 Tax=Panacibacter microcysteis TaxID=2793269 RepID=A0A931GYJ9_9BACT|nr:hypothetical protein [Panacibacter microcysteis]MBG9376392.1 hypothetical protein [Panacibacter microcysteis]
MKKILVATNIMLLGIIVFQACRTSRVTIPDVVASTTFCTSCSQDLVGHTAAEFIDVVSRYKKTHYDIINHDAAQYYGISNTQSQGQQYITQVQGQQYYDDARAVWFPLDTIKKFICNIEKYSAQLHVRSNELGIRFYYATYPGNFSFYPQRSGQHTLFMSPTIDVEGQAIDFDPHLTAANYINAGGTGVVNYLFMADLMNPASPQELMLCGPAASNYPVRPYPNANTITNASRVFWNNGNLCPTNCPRPGPNNQIYNTLTSVDAINPMGLGY